MKKIILWILIFSSMYFFTTCYSLRKISKEEFNSEIHGEKISLVTKKGKTYQFEKNQYVIKADTLYGEGNKILHESIESPFSGKIALEDIISLSAERINEGSTIIFIIGSIAVAAIALHFLFKSSHESVIGGI